MKSTFEVYMFVYGTEMNHMNKQNTMKNTHIDRFKVIDSSNDSICSINQCIDLLYWYSYIELLSDFNNRHRTKYQVISTFKNPQIESFFRLIHLHGNPFWIWRFSLSFPIWNMYKSLFTHTIFIVMLSSTFGCICPKFNHVCPNIWFVFFYKSTCRYINSHRCVFDLVHRRAETECVHKQIQNTVYIWMLDVPPLRSKNEFSLYISVKFIKITSSPTTKLGLLVMYFYFPCYVCFYNHLPSATEYDRISIVQTPLSHVCVCIYWMTTL